ncbi:MAG: hypothetical protein EP330_27115 [Deltaproteobacteria bacterium]|nr:MAG: hypothetical protein EP330_27115 [Deltaproteobacteria bacterium]
MVRTLVAALFWLAAIPTTALVAAHLALDDAGFASALLHAGAGYLWLGATPLGLWAWRSGSTPRQLVAVPSALIALGLVVPGTLPRTAPDGEADLRLVSANLLMVNPEPHDLLAELLAEDADILALQEVSPGWGALLDEVEGYPYRLVLPQEGSFGIAVLSRVPLEAEVLDLGGVPLIRAHTHIGARPLTVYAVHTLPPRSPEYTAIWHAQMAMLAAQAASTEGAVLFAGDLNATRHHPSYQRLLDAGLADAHGQRGRAAAATWPNGVFPLPTLRLDHVLVSDEIRVHHVHEGRGTGSDHRPVVVELGVGDRRLSSLER